jgi:hypothetical protein
MTAFSKVAKITTLVAFLPTVFASFLFTGCLQRDFSESKSKAITLRGQDATSRLYMAYDEAAPMRLTWFLCEGDPASTSSVIRTRARSADAPVMAAGRVARKRPLLPAILPSRAQTSPSSALESGPLVERYVDERMTIAEFRDPTLGKGCKDVLTAEGSASVSEIADETAARLAKEKEIDELGPQIFGTVASCSGIVKETLLIASVLLSADKTNVRSLFGFKGTAVAPGNRGSQLVGLFSGTAFCALSTRSLFNQLATGQGKVSVSDAQFIMAPVS